MAGHGVTNSDGGHTGWSPIPGKDLVRFLDHVSKNSHIWVSPFKNIALYEDIKHTASIELTNEDTMIHVKIDNERIETYKKYSFSNIPITLKITTICNSQIIYHNIDLAQSTTVPVEDLALQCGNNLIQSQSNH